jgi:hypothetical protein
MNANIVHERLERALEIFYSASRRVKKNGMDNPDID